MSNRLVAIIDCRAYEEPTDVLSIPESWVMHDLKVEYLDWYAKYKASGPNDRMKYLSFVEWLISHGARVPSESEIEFFYLDWS